MFSWFQLWFSQQNSKNLSKFCAILFLWRYILYVALLLYKLSLKKQGSLYIVQPDIVVQEVIADPLTSFYDILERWFLQMSLSTYQVDMDIVVCG